MRKQVSWMDLPLWATQPVGSPGSWRKDELTETLRFIESLRKKGTKALSGSYFLRDISVSLLEVVNGDLQKIDVKAVSSRLESLFGTKKDLSKVLSQSLDLWARGSGFNSVETYLTPKALLYTLRGDYAKYEKAPD